MSDLEVITNDKGLPVYAAGKFPDGSYGISIDGNGLCVHFKAPVYCEHCKEDWSQP
jgi:hypothetical protein